MSEKIKDLSFADDTAWDVPQSWIICGAHLINTVVQAVLKDVLRATGPDSGMDEADEDALIDLAGSSSSPIIKVGCFGYELQVAGYWQHVLQASCILI